MKVQLISLYIFLCLATCIVNSASAQNPDDKNWSDKFGYPGIISDGYISVAIYRDTIYLLASTNQYSQYRSTLYVSDGKTIRPFNHAPVFKRDGGGDGGIRDIAIDSSGNIYIIGSFDSVNGNVAKNIAMWNGSEWAAMGKGLYGGQNAGGYKIELIKGNIYAIGLFRYAGDELANSIARWDGNNWHGLDSGFVEYSHNEPAWFITSTVLNDSVLYTFARAPIKGKDFSSSTDGTVICWDGNHWSKIPALVTNKYFQDQTYVFVDIVSFNGSIYLSGIFDSIDGIFVNRLAKWDGEKWEGLSPNSYGGDIGGLSSCREGIYVLWQKNGALWTGSKWLDMLPGYNYFSGTYFNFGNQTFSNSPTTMIRDSSLLYLGLSEIKNKQLYPIIDSTQGGVTGEIKDLTTVGKDVYILGDFDGAGTKKNFKKPMHWDGISWNALPATDPPMNCNGIYSAGKLLYVSGDFKSTDGDSCTAIATWDGSKWGYMYPSTGGKPVFNNSSSARDFVVNEHGKIAFIEAERYYPEEMRNLYVVDELGIDWVASYVSCYAFKDDTLFVLSIIDSVATFSRWDKMNGRTDIDTMILLSVYSDRTVVGSPCSMAIHGDDIYIAGDFTHIDDTLVNNIAVWSNNSWHALGDGITDVGARYGYYTRTIEQIAFHGTTLYAAGYFIKAGDTTALNIAKWDGIEWSPVGSGVFERKYGNQIMSLGVIHCLSISDNKLFIAGAFTQAGGKNAQNISYYELPPLQSVRNTFSSTSLQSPKMNPNPTSGIITVTLDEANNEEITVSDVLGRIVKRATAFSNEITLDCTELPKGTYYLSVGSGTSEVRTAKFMIF